MIPAGYFIIASLLFIIVLICLFSPDICYFLHKSNLNRTIILIKHDTKKVFIFPDGLNNINIKAYTLLGYQRISNNQLNEVYTNYNIAIIGKDNLLHL